MVQWFSQRPEVKDRVWGAALGEEVWGVGAGLTRDLDLLGRAAPSTLTKHLCVRLRLCLWVTAKHEDQESPIAAAPRGPGGGPDLHRRFHSL